MVFLLKKAYKLLRLDVQSGVLRRHAGRMAEHRDVGKRHRPYRYRPERLLCST